jgi:hypothetical protein
VVTYALAVSVAPPRGSRVGVRYGGRIVSAVVVEDRGLIGDEHIVRVQVEAPASEEPPEFEVPVSELKPEPAAA